MNDVSVPALDDAIGIVVPARTEFASTVRVLATSLGADLGFSVDEIDDVRLALNEVFASAADIDDARHVSIVLRPHAGRLDVTAEVIGESDFQLDELAMTILRAMVDDLTVSGPTISFVKRAGDSAGK